VGLRPIIYGKKTVVAVLTAGTNRFINTTS
jgi:hypothetical protein